MKEDLENLREAYYKSIINLYDEQDILDNLPTTDFKNFYSLIDGIIEKINNDIDVIKNDLDDEELKEEYIHLKKCIELCTKRKNEALKIEENENDEIKGHKQIVLAENSMGTFLEKDLKYIEEEYYGDIFDCLNFINNPDSVNKKPEISHLTNNNRLKKVYELKLFKIRLFTKHLSNNMVYVFMARMKKDMNSNIDVREPAERIAYLNNEFEFIEKNMENEEFRRELQERNEKHLERITSFLKENARGDKTNGSK